MSYHLPGGPHRRNPRKKRMKKKLRKKILEMLTAGMRACFGRPIYDQYSEEEKKRMSDWAKSGEEER